MQQVENEESMQIVSPDTIIPSYTFTAPDFGPNLLVFGAIHGNEVCGTFAS